MNLFRYLCPACGGLYNDVVEKGKSKLLHRGLKSSNDKSKLPTSKCIPSHDYVVFRECGHCCPEVFAECRACKLGYPGAMRRPSHPSEEACYCHYCLKENSELHLLRLSGDLARELYVEKFKNKEFDVFLCYNKEDMEEVNEIAGELLKRGVHAGLDKYEIKPGLPWQQVLENNINSVKSAAIFVGSHGIGKWQKIEIDAFVRQFVSRGCPIIPVILKSCSAVPKLSVFLEGMHHVDFRQKDPNPMDQLIRGIIGKKPH